MNNKKYRNVRDHCYYAREYKGAVHSIYNLKYNVPKEIPIVYIIDQTMIIILS